MKKTIADLDCGEIGMVVEIRSSCQELNCSGIRSGENVKMITRQPIKGPVVVIAGDVEIAIGCDRAAGVVDIREKDQHDPA
ncbi:MAG: ferrous iron transport protein [Methanofollis sp.]|nr:ferrous iron transport protein [Methanofollis sp.]